jgi:hypothetical protein
MNFNVAIGIGRRAGAAVIPEPLVLSDLAWDAVNERFTLTTSWTDGDIHIAWPTTATPLTGQEVEDHPTGQTFANDEGPQTFTADLTGLADGVYYLQVVHELDGAFSNVVVTGPINIGEEVAAPVLTSLAMPDVDGPASVSTDVGAGTIYLRAQPSADAAPDPADVIAGGGTVSSNQAVVGTGAQSIPLDLTSAADGSYQVYGVHRRAGLFTPWVDSARVQLAAPFVKSSAWSPAALFGSGEPGLYYDINNLSSLWQDASGTVAVTAAGQTVRRINDLSGNGWHATQADTANAPVLQQLGGGQYYLKFDGVDDWLQTATMTWTGAVSGQLTAIVGARKLDDSARMIAEYSTAWFVNNHAFAIASGDGVRRWAFLARAVVSTLSIGPNTDAGAATAVLTNTISGADMEMRRNGVSAATGTIASTFAVPSSHALYIGSRGGTTLYNNGHLYSLIIRAKTLTAGELTSAEAWTAERCGVTL